MHAAAAGLGNTIQVRSRKGYGMRVRQMMAGVVLGTLFAVGASTAAVASPPLNTGGASVVDQANALSPSDLSRATSAVQQVANGSNAHLTVVFVDTFSSPANDQQWATATAQRSGLGSGDLLVAVAVQSHQFGFARSTKFPVDSATVSNLIATDMKPDLAQGKWADATVAFASGLQSQLGGGTGSAASPGGAVGSVILTLVLLIALVVVAFVLFRVLRRRRAAVTAGPSSAGSPVSPLAPGAQRALEAQASRALIALDDALTASEQEVGFVEAEFGDAAAKPSRLALDTARSQAKEAFGLRQRLDEATGEQRRTMAQRIIDLANQADASLTAQKQGFDDLRKLEANLPAAVRAADAERAVFVSGSALPRQRSTTHPPLRPGRHHRHGGRSCPCPLAARLRGRSARTGRFGFLRQRSGRPPGCPAGPRAVGNAAGRVHGGTRGLRRSQASARHNPVGDP